MNLRSRQSISTTTSLAALIVAAAIITGCGKQEEPVLSKPPSQVTAPAPEQAPPAAMEKPVVNTETPMATAPDAGKPVGLLDAFSSADADTHALVEKLAAALSTGNYFEALRLIPQVSAKGNLTADQEQALAIATDIAKSNAAATAINPGTR